MKIRIVLSGITAITLAIGLIGSNSAVADASSSLVSGSTSKSVEGTLSPDLVEKSMQELDAAGYEYTRVAGARIYELEEGRTLALPVPATLGRGGGGASLTVPMLNGGVMSNNQGVWIDFNKADQQAIVNGSGAALAGGLCLIGPATCIIAAVIIAVAATYLSDGVLCSQTLRIEFDWNGVAQRSYCR